MKKWQILPGPIQGSIVIPPSKSHTLRAILFGLMGNGKTRINHYLNSPDSAAMISAVRAFGAHVDVESCHLTITGVGGKLQPAHNVIDSGNSGQVLRFIGALATLSSGYTVITGDHSICHQRPVQPLLQALTELGAFAVSTRLNGYAPIVLKGPLLPGKTQLDGSDSQPVSGMLIATAFLPGKSEIHVSNPGETPWIDLTLHWMHKLGISVEHQHYTHYTVHGNAAYEGFEAAIPGDWSSAAFSIAAALVTQSELTLENIDTDDCQGDKKIIAILRAMGALIETDNTAKTLRVKRGARLFGARIDINATIDALPILAVIACYAEGTTEIFNASIARHKESDRILAIATELKKMGAVIEETEDGLRIQGSSLQGAKLFSYNDHRIAMALAIAALGATSESLIENTECAAKTYRSFVQDFQSIGAAIKEIG
ncbi:MAG: 3-phosphoshikimate 1-carboxyvinyltransferase [Rhabdochlamydiaceae bacterium]|nr:3-phosphoshikimate 1-carboxyvinyltransferase [Rhabdochlamydiaceae bacterium]